MYMTAAAKTRSLWTAGIQPAYAPLILGAFVVIALLSSCSMNLSAGEANPVPNPRDDQPPPPGLLGEFEGQNVQDIDVRGAQRVTEGTSSNSSARAKAGRSSRKSGKRTGT